MFVLNYVCTFWEFFCYAVYFVLFNLVKSVAHSVNYV